MTLATSVTDQDPHSALPLAAGRWALTRCKLANVGCRQSHLEAPTLCYQLRHVAGRSISEGERVPCVQQRPVAIRYKHDMAKYDCQTVVTVTSPVQARGLAQQRSAAATEDTADDLEVLIVVGCWTGSHSTQKSAPHQTPVGANC